MRTRNILDRRSLVIIPEWKLWMTVHSFLPGPGLLSSVETYRTEVRLVSGRTGSGCERSEHSPSLFTLSQNSDDHPSNLPIHIYLTADPLSADPHKHS